MLHFTKLKLRTSAVRRIPSTINPKTLTQHKSGQFSCIVSSLHNYENPSFRTSNIRFIGQKRFYYDDRNGANWFQNWRNTSIYLTLGTVGSGPYIYYNQETVPYNNRNHIVSLSTRFERWLGLQVFRYEKKKARDKILPAEHPTNVRVRG